MSSPHREEPSSSRSPFADRQRFAELERGFDELSDCSPEQRRRRLDELAAVRPELAADLAMLLAAAEVPADFLDVDAPTLSQALVEALAEVEGNDREMTATARPGDRIGAWRLTEPLGAGGMGEVWSAERDDGGYSQTAALKLLKRGLESDAIVRRFLQERQILARLSHPGIARLLDGGLSPDGRPYFVLERVDGVPITRYAAERGLGVDERLGLVAACCRAAESAHRRMVVHRDLKPANVLVTAEGRPVLLDFGIAKVLTPDADGEATAVQQRILTPDYAAPEQILGEPVSAATDVYALGAMLYELLTGTPPHRRAHATPTALVAALASEEIERPSRRLRRDPVAMATSLPLESTRERERWSRSLEGDVDLVVLTALHRDPERRYASAAALREDIERLLAGRPITARADTAAYRLRKFLGRHRWAAAAAAALVVSLVGGVVATLWQSRHALAEAGEARRQAARAGEVERLLASMFQVADPAHARGATITARELLADAAKKLGGDLGGQPDVAARLLVTLAEVDQNLGLYPEAETQARRAIAIARRSLPPGDPALLRALWVLSGTRDQARDAAGALHPAVEALTRARTFFPSGSLEVARAAAQSAEALADFDRTEEALPLAREALRIETAKLGPDDLTTLRQLSNVAVDLDTLEHYDESIALAKRALAGFEARLGPQDPEVARVCHNLGSTLTWMGRYAEAEPYFRRAIAIRRKVLGPSHPWLAYTLSEYSILLTREGHYDEAIHRSREALAIYRAISPDEPHIPTCLNSIAVDEYIGGEYRPALADFDAALAAGAARLGETSSAVLTWRSNHGMALAQVGRLTEADRELTEAVARDRVTEGTESTPVAAMLRKLAAVKRLEGRLAEAESLQREALAISIGKLGSDGVAASDARVGLAQILLERGGAERLAEAEREARRGLDAMVKVDPKHVRVLEGRKVLARIRLAEGARSEARAMLGRLVADAANLRGEHAPETSEARFWLATATDPSGRSPAARRELAEAARDLLAAHGPDYPLARRAVELLGPAATSRAGI